jgi:hypothetical protein
MLQAFRDARADHTLDRNALLRLTLRDLLISLIKEHFAMQRDTFTRPALVFNALVLSGIATVLALALYGIPQSVLRSGANDPQVQLAGDLAAHLQQGMPVADAVPPASIDLNRSLSPFLIAYDKDGRPLASQATLDGATPVLPRGVFDYVRQHGEDRITWQPRPHLRIAAIVERVDGGQGGFVVAGRSMREVEDRIGNVQAMAGLAWLGMLGLILAGTVAVGWYTRTTGA